MNGSGVKAERETVINFNEESDEASIWTASETVYRRLVKRGWFPAEDAERHALFIVTKSAIKLPLNRTSKAKLLRGFAIKPKL